MPLVCLEHWEFIAHFNYLLPFDVLKSDWIGWSSQRWRHYKGFPHLTGANHPPKQAILKLAREDFEQFLVDFDPLPPLTFQKNISSVLDDSRGCSNRPQKSGFPPKSGRFSCLYVTTFTLQKGWSHKRGITVWQKHDIQNCEELTVSWYLTVRCRMTHPPVSSVGLPWISKGPTVFVSVSSGQ